jgi:23S rRNA-/tRNA-specific pseudouridylate synthase
MKTYESSEPKVIALTESWLVLLKPSGWLTIPGRMSAQNKANQQEIPVLSEWSKINFGSTWVVHRLDLETSGIVLFARNPEFHQKANLWFQKRQMKKIYHCLASGVPRTPIFKIQEPIEGASSTTQIEVKESFQEGFFAKVMPQTGRRHQIRIHLASKGFPIWGDSLYRGVSQIDFKNEFKSDVKTEPFLVNRVALHASSLTLPTGEVFEAPLTEDFSTWLEQLRKRGTPCLY